jgi:hypothetical protein
MEQLALRYKRLLQLKQNVNLPDGVRSEAEGLIEDLIMEHDKYERYLDVNYRAIIRDA